MKFVIFIVLCLLSLTDASHFASPLHAPTISPTPAPSHSDCSSVIYGMMDCLSFLLKGSNDSSPTKTCCDGIKTVLDYNPQCLCYAIKSSEAMGFTLDNTKAFAMPSTCNVNVDPHCEVATPIASPSPSAEPPSPSPPTKKPPSPSPPPKKPPTISPSSPTVTPSLPHVTKPPMPTTSSPAPSPSKSSSGNLSASKLFLAAIIVSSFALVLA
ncbi:hypothetical protein AALP_AAs67745U000400 [Arabis alpina]|uniref:Bifunctional inhibitor/plant lipid transfer protein/seed storage helical domain-containing protein n=1 Tax=Arabis alpina TaxID=50452 RepID=A0A087G2A3_ARAAL|nr:hypothetical protein AALP_AAs67745U000400 [Arabis alpina]